MVEFIIGLIIVGIIIGVIVINNSKEDDTTSSNYQGGNGGVLGEIPQDDDLKDIKDHENVI